MSLITPILDVFSFVFFLRQLVIPTKREVVIKNKEVFLIIHLLF